MPNAPRLTCKAIIHRAHALTLSERRHSAAPDWARRHINAFTRSNAIAYMIEALGMYADRHYDRYESTIGDDGVLGEGWASMAQGLLTLLNGELGGLDGGTCDGIIREMMRANSVDPDTGALHYEETATDA
jgi:hypothetical protein